MKNYELFEITQRLGSVLPTLEKLKGAKFHYALLKNIDLLQKEIELLQTKSKPNEKFTAYEKVRVELCEAFCAKDEKGECKKRDLGGGQLEYDIDTTSEAWLTAIGDLKNNNKEIIAEREQQINEFNELLDIESVVQFHKIKIEDLPSDINGEQMASLKFFIQE